MTQEEALDEQRNDRENKQRIKWVNTISITAIHLLALYSVFTIVHRVLWQTFLWGEFFFHS
jgi:fatty acid desaturase